MTTKQIESGVQDRIVYSYRNEWGYPLGINRTVSRAQSAAVAVVCFLLIAFVLVCL